MNRDVSRSAAAFAFLFGAGAAVAAEPAGTAPQVVWNQPPSGDIAIFSSHSTTENGGVYTAADFVLAADTRLTQIQAFGFTNPPDALHAQPGITWSIYADDGGQPAGDPEIDPDAALWTYSSPPDGPGVSIPATEATITLDLALAGEHVDLPPGVYWLSVYPSFNNAISDGGGWNWYQAETVDVGSMVIAPNLFGMNDWTLTGPGGMDSPVEDVAFNLSGIQAAADCLFGDGFESGGDGSCGK